MVHLKAAKYFCGITPRGNGCFQEMEGGAIYIYIYKKNTNIFLRNNNDQKNLNADWTNAYKLKTVMSQTQKKK